MCVGQYHVDADKRMIADMSRTQSGTCYEALRHCRRCGCSNFDVVQDVRNMARRSKEQHPGAGCNDLAQGWSVTMDLTRLRSAYALIWAGSRYSIFHVSGQAIQ